MIAIIDYGMGNLRSVQKALEKNGAQTVITQSAADIEQADKVVLPGVGAMRPAMEKLDSLGLIETIKNTVKSGKPFFGICLGFQLLFDKGYEGGEVPGLSILPGTVEKFSELKVPHMGWNQLNFKKDCAIFNGIPSGADVYFCHSYFVKPKDTTLAAATTTYGIDFVSAVAEGNTFGVQFHPEKSQKVGLQILKNFTELKA